MSPEKFDNLHLKLLCIEEQDSIASYRIINDPSEQSQVCGWCYRILLLRKLQL